MAKKQYIVAIEIGSSKVVGAVAEKSSDNRLTVSHLISETQTNCVSYGQVQNVENIKSSINRILGSISRSLDGNITQVFVGMGGRSVHSEASEINRSIDASQPITPATINAILREGSRNNVKQYETLEAVPRAFFVDKKLVSNNDPAGQYGSSLKIQFNMIVASKAIKLALSRVMNTICPNTRYITTTLAMGKHILTDEEKRLGCMLVDMGAETTSVAIYKSGMLQYFNTLPLGGRNLTIDVANGMKVLEDSAERIKKNINNPLDLQLVDSIVVEGVNSKEAAQYINARAGEIIANVNKQLEYANMTAGDISSIVLTGGAAQLKGMAKKLEDTIKVPVREANMPANVFFTPASRANSPENVQIVSLIAEAALAMDPMDTCLDVRAYDDGFDVDTKPVQPVNPEPERPEPQKKPEPQKGGWLRKLSDKFNNLISDADQDLD